MNLFTLDHNRVVTSPEALVIKEFKDLWSRDTTKNKNIAVEELAYVYYMTDYQSLYRQYDTDTRELKVIKDVISDKKWLPDDVVRAAILKYVELQETPSMGVLRDARTALYKIREYFRDISVTDDTSGKVTQTLINNVAKLGDLIQGLKSLEELVEKEITEGKRIRGKGTLVMREMPKK